MNTNIQDATAALFANAIPFQHTHASPAPSYESDDHEAGPSRKRPRSDMTTEQRKEARAHRNRIAAQNSRDKRKAEFSHLHQRVADLEAENARLRAGAPVIVHAATSSPDQSAWEQENAALKERIRTLEKGWDVILKALAAQGLPAALLAGSVPTSTATATPVTPTVTAVTPASPVFPPTPASLSPAFVAPSPVLASPELPESARHPARVATAVKPASQQRADSVMLLRTARSLRVSRRQTVLRTLRHLRLTRGWQTSWRASARR
jgi:cell division protein FtsB